MSKLSDRLGFAPIYKDAKSVRLASACCGAMYKHGILVSHVCQVVEVTSIPSTEGIRVQYAYKLIVL